MTSMSDALDPQLHTTLGIAEASAALGISGSQTALFGSTGETVDATTVLIKYTWAGDADLSGWIDADDYYRINTGYPAGAKGYYNGDFDYNGVIDSDDYWLINRNYNYQNQVL